MGSSKGDTHPPGNTLDCDVFTATTQVRMLSGLSRGIQQAFSEGACVHTAEVISHGQNMADPEIIMPLTTLLLLISLERKVCGALRFMPSLFPRWL